MKRVLFILLIAYYPLLGISLNRLIDIGLKKSTIIQISKANIDYSRLQREEHKARQLGSLDFVSSYNHYNLPRTLAPLSPISLKDPVVSANIATTQDMFSSGISYSVPLFTGFAHTKEIEIDDIANSLARSKHILTKEQLVYNISSIYLSILASQEILLAQKSYVKALRKLSNQISLEISLGKKSQIDLLKAQSDLEGNLAYFEVLKENIVISKASLASLVGIKRIRRLKKIRVKVRRPNYSIKKLMRRASNLHKIRISNLNISKSNKIIEKNKLSKLPQVSLNSYYGYNYGANDSANPHSGDFNSEENWQVGVNLKWNVIDFGKRNKSIEKAKVLKLKNTLAKRQNLLDIKKSLIEAISKLKQEYAYYKGNIKQLKLVKKSEKIEGVRYTNNASTLNDLLYAKSRTNLARAKVIQSKYNYQKAKYYMNYILEKGRK